ncbi:MAG: hypothetical protein IPI31_13985 [Bacteroidetes bacterium]|nr:hypothetical protein [Bacteroidota bacterium]
MNDIIKHKQEFIDELMKIGYTVYINREDLSEIRIKGKDTSIVCNLKTTRHKTHLEHYDIIWYGVAENVLDRVDYVILLPLDTKTFYVIPKSLLLANKELFFKSEEGKYSFHLVFSEEMITGLQNKGYIDLSGTYGILFQQDFKFSDINSPELPFFPSLS